MEVARRENRTSPESRLTAVRNGKFEMPKVTLIGAWSTVFAHALLQDLFTFPELHDCTISLMDIDEERLGDTELWLDG